MWNRKVSDVSGLSNNSKDSSTAPTKSNQQKCSQGPKGQDFTEQQNVWEKLTAIFFCNLWLMSERLQQHWRNEVPVHLVYLSTVTCLQTKRPELHFVLCKLTQCCLSPFTGDETSSSTESALSLVCTPALFLYSVHSLIIIVHRAFLHFYFVGPAVYI